MSMDWPTAWRAAAKKQRLMRNDVRRERDVLRRGCEAFVTETGAALRRAEAAEAKLEARPLFPMQGGPRISWELAENIYKAYSAVFGADQSLERMAERGGFGWGEVSVIGKEYRRRFGRDPEGWSGK